MKQSRILGMMSGTSLDGLDLALVTLQPGETGWDFTFEATECIPYSEAWHQKLETAITLPAPELLGLHAQYGRWLGTQARTFLNTTGLSTDAIASHGHTVHHLPQQGFTFQVGCPQHLALEAGVRTIGDFRSLDVALGGQGAPLVPIGDRLLFSQYDCCLNLGGISNISLEWKGNRIAFDTSIANMLLNPLSQMAGKPFDAGGQLARSGRLIPDLLASLDMLDYYQKPYPKSIGYEWFTAEVWPLLVPRKEPVADLLHTAVQHMTGQIARQVRELLGNTSSRVLATGGGAFNTFLIEVLQQKLGDHIRVTVPDARLIAFKEALVFALLGALRLEGATNVLASVTGARRDSCSGVVFEP